MLDKNYQFGIFYIIMMIAIACGLILIGVTLYNYSIMPEPNNQQANNL